MIRGRLMNLTNNSNSWRAETAVKTYVRIASGNRKGSVGWIRGTMPVDAHVRTAVMVRFPKRFFPLDFQRVPVNRLVEITKHEAFLCGVDVE
jgi:hypothetical protein